MRKVSKKTVRDIYARNRKIMLGMFIVGFIFGIGFLTIDLPKVPSLFEPKTASRIDPYDLLLKMKKGKYDTFLLIDTRSKKDFLKGHIKSAVSFPLYDEKGDPRKLDNSLISDFWENYKDEKRQIILYGTFGESVQIEELSNRLTSKGVKSTRLSVGWNEWRHFRNLWLPESMWDTVRMDEYVSE